MKLKNLRIGQRLALGFGVVIALLIMLAALSYSRIASLAGEFNLTIKDRYPKTVVSNRIKADLSEVTRSMLNVLIMSDAGQIKKELANIGDKSKRIDDAVATLGKEAGDDQEREHVKAIVEVKDKFLPAQAGFVKLVSEDSKDEAMMKLMFSIRPLQSKYFEQLDTLIQYENGRMEQSGDTANSTAVRTELLILVLAVVASVMSMLVALLSTRSITLPLNEAVGIARRVADGDLTSDIQVRTQDETGQLMDALRHMNDSLSRIVGDVRAGTETMSMASREIAGGNQDLSRRTEEQSAELQRTALAMEELTSTVKQNAENALQANQLAASASEVAMQGGGVVSQVIETMGSINASSKKIVDIISVINGIAFQTNILALNAAVEAARAGEQGRGFAVVAAEVRSLAQRSAEAAKEIEALIGDSVDKVEQGSKLVGQAGITMDEVVASIKRVTDIVAEISAASHEQSMGIEDVNGAIAKMDTATQQNAALVEEAAGAAESMHDQSGNLARTVSVFKLPDGSDPAPAPRLDIVASEPVAPASAKITPLPVSRARMIAH